MSDVLRTKPFWAGLFLVTVGFLVPFLQVLGLLPYNLWLSMAGYVCSICGLFLGILSAASAYRERERPDPRDDMWSG